jgi:CheY-like chemotaxis protein
MNNAAGKMVMILMLQYSVIVKGIEKKLADMGCVVNTFSEELENRVKRFINETELFLFYLPGDLTDDASKVRQMEHICEILAEHQKKIIFIGEAKYHDDLKKEFPLVAEYVWMNRPVDMKALETKVEQAFSATETTKEGTASGRKKRILVVDDDPSFAKMIREWIKEDYRVDIVTGGMQAITFLLKVPEDEPVDLVLLDYEMPVVDGPQVLQMLRQEPATSHIPVIFLTGIASKEAIMRVMSLKPDGYLLKTTMRAEILAFLKEKLG